FTLYLTHPATTMFSTLSLHDALPIYVHPRYHRRFQQSVMTALETLERGSPDELVLSVLDRRREAVRPGSKSLHGLAGYELAEIADRKSTRLNSSHRTISYAVFCLKKK